MLKIKKVPFAGFGLNETFKELDKFFEETVGFNDIMKYSPRTNFKEEDEHYIAELEVPGIPKEDISISLEDNRMTISYKSKKEDSKETSYKSIEFKIKSFNKSFVLPKKSNLESVTSTCEYGILYIKIPKLKSDKKVSKNIKIS